MQPYRLALLADALRLLPVRPQKARYALGRAKHEATRLGSAEVHGVPVTLEELDELFLGDTAGAPRISREGALVLLKLFRAGAFVTCDERFVDGGVELLEAYGRGEASMICSWFWRKRRHWSTQTPS
jgi:hypothetical protein